ncbi:hypothetical protein HPP92_024707 [Vanilla planifolia]|uniref:Enhanced disease resistance 4-like N-terminal domain-containing protein n=1 Tax=Vanilla planifolia TaxID=51239 RepID=A0A835U8H9_VANPL|nr:hypothetical protein HPP92_024982 [Vanilla planifolia]KAG0453403.1 hypothetical protein HPP92_024707 [Vanilla planifolia]
MMASKIPDFRFVRCPKCLKLLAEVPGIPLYKCGGCGTTLRAKMHSNGGESVDLASVASSSRNISESYSLDHGTETNAKAITAVSDEHGELDRAVKNCSGVEENSKEELFTNKQQTPVVTAYDANTESSQEKEESALLEQQEHRMLKERKPSNVAVTKDLGLGSIKLSDKLEVSPEIVEHESTSDDDMKNGKLIVRSTSSRAYEGNLSSTDEERMHRIPQKYLLLSKRTFRSRRSSDSDESIREAGDDSTRKIADPKEQLTDRNHSWKHSNGGLQQLVSTGNVNVGNGKETEKPDSSFVSEDFLSVQNWTEPEKEASFVPQTKDTKLFEFRNLKKDDHAKILRKVDELKDELHGFFNKAAHGGEIGGTFKGRVRPKEYRSSSLLPFSNQPISSSCSFVIQKGALLPQRTLQALPSQCLLPSFGSRRKPRSRNTESAAKR